MHKEFDFTQEGGFPLEQDRLAWMQAGAQGLSQAIVGLVGDNVIVSGIEVAGSNLTAGWVVLGGELMPFAGGAGNAASLIRPVVITTNLTFQDGGQKPVQFERTAVLGAGTGAVRVDSLRRIGGVLGSADLGSSVATEGRMRDAESDLTDLAKLLDQHAKDVSNPHKVSASQVGLGKVNNTADVDKPVSDAQQKALDKKADLIGGLVPLSQLPASAAGDASGWIRAYVVFGSSMDSQDTVYYKYFARSSDKTAVVAVRFDNTYISSGTDVYIYFPENVKNIFGEVTVRIIQAGTTKQLAQVVLQKTGVGVQYAKLGIAPNVATPLSFSGSGILAVEVVK